MIQQQTADSRQLLTNRKRFGAGLYMKITGQI